MKLIFAYLKQLPQALQMQLLLRSGSGVLALVLFLVVLLLSGEFTFALPCLILSVLMLAHSWSLLRCVIVGNFLCVSGPCEEIERVGLRRRIKTITVRLGDKRVVLPIRHRVKILNIGTTVTLYVSEKTPIYENDGLCHIYEYLAISFGEQPS